MGCLCVVAFCRRFCISHPFINEYIAHQINLLKSNDILTWNAIGRRLAITGLGDPIPEVVKREVQEHLVEDLRILLDSSTEIGVVDLFGDNTEEPSRFLLKCCSVLSKHQIAIPFDRVDVKTLRWGEPLEDRTFRALINSYSKFLEGYYSLEESPDPPPSTPRS